MANINELTQQYRDQASALEAQVTYPVVEGTDNAALLSQEIATEDVVRTLEMMERGDFDRERAIEILRDLGQDEAADQLESL